MVPYNLRFPGEIFDGRAGLDQNGHRDFDPRPDGLVDTSRLVTLLASTAVTTCVLIVNSASARHIEMSAKCQPNDTGCFPMAEDRITDSERSNFGYMRGSTNGIWERTGKRIHFSSA